MNLARVSPNGQITVPKEVRTILGVRAGDKIVFLEKDGEIVLQNSQNIIKEAQAAFADVDISEQDILSEVMSDRYGKGIQQ
ncbi:hypothetical protein FACS189425_03950 [Clostridia bacterium]|nr:hypothetical protein FACS189425_03950 [Clostridia bacterium]